MERQAFCGGDGSEVGAEEAARNPPPPPVFHHYRPADPRARCLKEVRPCLKCTVVLSNCKCDVDAEARAVERARALASRASEGATRGPFERTVKNYSWSDDGGSVSVYVSIDEARELKYDHIEVTFPSKRSFHLSLSLPGDLNRIYRLNVDSLYGEVDPEESTWFISRQKRRVVVKLAKHRQPSLGERGGEDQTEGRRTRPAPWPGLTAVFAVAKQSDTGSFGLATMMGGASLTDVRGVERDSGVIVSSKKKYWQGPPTYEWDAYDRDRDVRGGRDPMLQQFADLRARKSAK